MSVNIGIIYCKYSNVRTKDHVYCPNASYFLSSIDIKIKNHLPEGASGFQYQEDIISEKFVDIDCS
jgi:hypothetical protein